MIGVTDARYIRDYVLWLRFSDGSEGELDLRAELRGEVFEPLKDPAKFRAFRVHPQWKTLFWPNGADFAPELLYAAVTARRVRGRARAKTPPAARRPRKKGTARARG